MLPAAPRPAGMGPPVTVRVNFRGNVKRLLAPDPDRSEWEAVDAWVRALRAAHLREEARGSERRFREEARGPERSFREEARGSERRPEVQRGGPRGRDIVQRGGPWRPGHSSERRP